MSAWRLSWPAAWGEPVGRASMRVHPEDFDVEEVLGFLPEGQGEHLYVFLEKVGDNTDYVARQLAELSGCRPMDVGLSGLKDRHAVTRQWFSLYRPGMDDAAFLDGVAARWKLLSHGRHPVKLRRGTHTANRFRLVLRDLEADSAQLQARLQRIAAEGCPNYFGPQRFGRDGGNLDAAARLNARKLRGKDPRRGLYLSAARSWLFNEVLAQRILENDWRSLRAGDPGDGVPTGPLFGDGGSSAGEPLLSWENVILAPHEAFRSLFDGARIRPERRPLVLRPQDFEFELTESCLKLQFALPSGSFATAVVGELLEVEDKSVRVAQ